MSEELLNGLKGVFELAKGGSTELMDEALNLFIVLSVLDILKYASVFIVFYVVKRFLDTVGEASGDDKTKRLVYSAKTAGLVASIIFFVAHSYSGVVNMAKVTVAPKIFLMEKGYDLYKDVKSK